jgi:hypothetical protein
MQQVDVQICSRFLLQICSRRCLVYVSLSSILKYLLAVGDAVTVGGAVAVGGEITP